MKADFGFKQLLFPEFDPAQIEMAHLEDKESGRVKVDSRDDSAEALYDTLEDCVIEIELLKDELASIVHSQVGTSMRDHWDTPETKLAGGKKGRMRKDRYTSLLMANMIGRTLQRRVKEPEYRPMGGFAHELSGNVRPGPAWASGPAWYTEAVGDLSGYGAVARRGVR
jgi:hypothetical protein